MVDKVGKGESQNGKSDKDKKKIKRTNKKGQMYAYLITEQKTEIVMKE